MTGTTEGTELAGSENEPKRLHERRERPIPDQPPGFRHDRFLKADFFSRSDLGTYDDGRGGVPTVAVRRDVTFARFWTLPVALHLAWRERRALRRIKDMEDVPNLLFESRFFTVRSWIEARPLQEARPTDPAFYSAARKLLVRLHRKGIAHNDLAKQQNWLVQPDGRPALIDFQLASVFTRRTWRFKMMAREDLRHLLKHKRTYCPDALTPSERRMLATPSLPSRLWRKTGKPVYNWVTRKVFRWSDGEGQGELPPAQEREIRG